MNEYQKRYKKLNAAQAEAVDTIEGPLLVIAGPGTGKTELLSMRTAAILQATDTLPRNILCLTFTESGASAMRERLRGIIGGDAYKVAIQTFHSFGTDIISHYPEYFYRGARMQPADELAQYEIMRGIFDDLPYTNPLAGMNGDEYTHLKDALRALSELKQSGLTSAELRNILDANELAMEAVKHDIAEVFASRISATTRQKLAPVAQKVAALPEASLPLGVTPYAQVLAVSIANAVKEAEVEESTKPLTAWKSEWCEKDSDGKTTVLKDSRRLSKLRALAGVYDEYLQRLEAAQLYDFDDMILQVVHAIETQSDLRAELQETYHYILVDEFQDTNQAQLRVLFNLMPEPSSNIMAVGDDDQAIYSFQGADVGNIQRFRSHYRDPHVVALTDNYRSSTPILREARHVITQADDRLEDSIDDLSKELRARADHASTEVALLSFTSDAQERAGVVEAVAQKLAAGVNADSIAVIARQHRELEALLPYFADKNIAVNYERRENVLDHDIVRQLEHGLRIIHHLQRGTHDAAEALLPEFLAHPAFELSAEQLWRLSLAAWKNHTTWFENMLENDSLAPIAMWLLELAKLAEQQPLEQTIDQLLGVPDAESAANGAYVSPFYQHYFSAERRLSEADDYLTTLEALRTIRDRLREHYGHETPNLMLFLNFIDTHRQLGSGLTAVRRRSSSSVEQVHLLTAHKSKGLEFDHVLVIGATDNRWGERVRSKSSLIRWPANLHLSPVGASPSERIRLFYVAMTRARQALTISFALADRNGKPTLAASFLSDTNLTASSAPDTTDATELHTTRLDWLGEHIRSHSADLAAVLAPTLESYKLSATHLGNFLDVSRGGPQTFLLNNLLRFPQAKSAHASFGTAVHTTLQHAHEYVRRTGKKQPVEDILGLFEINLEKQHLTTEDFETFRQKGIDALGAFLAQHYNDFASNDRTELSFSGQGVVVGEARLTGALDVAQIDSKAKTITVTDYKTGKPARDWKGKSDYEKIKLHKYRQQLLFYQLLTENSREFSTYRFQEGILQFIEPETATGDILRLEHSASSDELAEFRELIAAVWQSIMTLHLPDTSHYPPTLKGVLAFEADLIDKYKKA